MTPLVIHALTTAGDSMGVDAAVRELAIAQRRAGADVHILVNGVWHDDGTREAGVVVHEGGMADAWRTLRALARDSTVLHNHMIWSPTTLLPLVTDRLDNLRTLISSHGCLADEMFNHKRWKKLAAWHTIFGRAVRAHDAIITTSGPERAEAVARCPDMPVIILPNTLAPPAGKVNVADIQSPAIGFLGRLNPVKGVLELVEAWMQIADRHPEWRLRIVGPTEDANYADVVRATAGTCPSISLEKALFGLDKWQFLAECEIVAAPSHVENFCFVVAEAYLMGTPVVTTLGVPWPSLQSESMGWRGAGDANSLAEMLDTAVTATSEKRAEMGQRGKAFVEAQFGYDAIAEQSFKVYAGLKSRT